MLGIVGVDGGSGPRGLALARPSRNPARGSVALRFSVPVDGWVSLAVYDAAGRRVRTLVEGAMPAGERERVWDLRAADGAEVGAGLYFVRLEGLGRRFTQRLAVVR